MAAFQAVMFYRGLLISRACIKVVSMGDGRVTQEVLAGRVGVYLPLLCASLTVVIGGVSQSC